METKNIKRKNVITITVAKAIFIFVSSILAAAGSSAWASFNLAQSIPFRVQANERDISGLKIEQVEDRKTLEEVKKDIAVIKNDVTNVKEISKETRDILRGWRLDQCK